MEWILSTLLFFGGIALSAAVILLSIYHIVKRRRRLLFSLYTLMSCGYTVLAAANLIRQRSGIACAMTPLRQLLIFGGLFLLHLFFLADALRDLPKDTTNNQPS